MSRTTPLLLLAGLLAAPLAAGSAQERVRPTPRSEAPRERPVRPEPRREEPSPTRAEPRREEPRRLRDEPRREPPAERRDAETERRATPPPRSTGEPELRRRKAEKPD